MKRAILQVADTTYKVVTGISHLSVGTDGSVWSRSKFGPNSQKVRRGEWRLLSPRADQDGYLRITTCVAGKKASPIGVHTLVLITFVGPCPNGMECRHLDGNPANNVIGNLEWATPSVNAKDKWLHGTQQTGERNGNAKLTESGVKAIRIMGKVYGGKSKASRLFGISRDTAEKICSGKLWGWLK
jgi:hypothetical protein